MRSTMRSGYRSWSFMTLPAAFSGISAYVELVIEPRV
jgi:hypothetical protein